MRTCCVCGGTGRLGSPVTFCGHCLGTGVNPREDSFSNSLQETNSVSIVCFWVAVIVQVSTIISLLLLLL